MKRIAFVIFLLILIISGFLLWPKPESDDLQQNASILFLGYTNISNPPKSLYYQVKRGNITCIEETNSGEPDSAGITKPASQRYALFLLTNSSRAEIICHNCIELKTPHTWIDTNFMYRIVESNFGSIQASEAMTLAIQVDSNLTWRVRSEIHERTRDDRMSDARDLITTTITQGRLGSKKSFSGRHYEIESPEISD
jgi:hypothetical protein